MWNLKLIYKQNENVVYKLHILLGSQNWTWLEKEVEKLKNWKIVKIEKDWAPGSFVWTDF